MIQIKILSIFSVCLILSSCAKDAPAGPSDNGSSGTNLSMAKPAIVLTRPKPVAIVVPKPLEESIEVSIVTPDVAKRYSRRTGATTPGVESKTISLASFVRTLEGTRLTLKIKTSSPLILDESTTFTLMGQGEVLDQVVETLTRNQNSVELEFRTPWLGRKEREDGFQNLTYDIMVTNSKHSTHLPFSLTIYDTDSATYILPRDASCNIYEKPVPASGCFQNRTRSTQEVVFNDSFTLGSDSNISTSGGITIGIAIVQAQFGLSKTSTQSQTVSRGSEIHFTNCIECASLIFRQTVETIRKGDVYNVLADGSLVWVGDVTYRTKAFAYEFSSTGSESKNYSCEMQSQLPVGRTPSCNDLGNGI